MAALPSYIPLPEAARRLGLSETRIRTLVETGKIKAVEINGEIAVSKESVEKREQAPNTFRKEDLPEYKKFGHLAGVRISVNESARKYNVSNRSISRWMRAGYIKKIEHLGQKIFIDEQDVAYCANIYHQRNASQGKWLFNKDGTPYVPQKH